ncbi:hypothetical protein ACXU4B_00750 [Dyella soli]|uniref:Rho-binding antiterminator n=1 Tax=Dyella soli TaxID=522319 RepID=A0A4R0YL96_9GAMM|nr:hypothetical protein [Dyella soli]TCI09607.1 hypothetical protein EZM97_11620 [Dyella soli]
MTTLPSPYVPISCEFHDLLEALATTGRPAQMGFRDAAGEVQRRMASIVDVFARDAAEYLSTSTGETVRLDQLLDVDGAPLPDH